MAITLPLVFLILDFWPLGRLQTLQKKAIFEKVPFFIVLLVLWGNLTGVNTPIPAGQGLFWFMNGFRSIAFYLYKMILPLDLTPFYPFPHLITESYRLENDAAVMGVILLSLLLFYYRRKAPHLFAAWLYYLVTLAPVSGFFLTGSFAAADRYTYLPSLGVFLPVSVFATVLISNRKIVFYLFTRVRHLN